MITGIQIRDHLLTLITTTFPDIPSNHIISQKLDAVEKFPFAAVFLEEMDSAPAGMRLCMSREQDIVVVIYREGDTIDLEKKFAEDNDLYELEVEKARRLKSSTAFGKETSIHLRNSRMTFPDDSKAKRGALVMTFRAKYARHIHL